MLKQLQAGANFADLAKKYSDDPGSKDQGGELPLIATSQLDPAYAKAAMALNPGQTSGLVRSQFGYHIIQTEQKQAAGVKPLAEVKDSIVQLLQQQKAGAAEQQFAAQLAAEAKKNGLDKTAAAHGLHAVTTDYVAKDGVIGGLSDAASSADAGVLDGQGRGAGDGFDRRRLRDVRGAGYEAGARSGLLRSTRRIFWTTTASRRRRQMLADETKKLDDRAKVLNDLKKAAAEMKVPVKSSDLVGQDGQVPDLGAMSGPGAVAFTLAEGTDLRADQRGTDRRGAGGDRQAGADGGRDCEELRPDAGAAAERPAGRDLPRVSGDGFGEVPGRRRDTADEAGGGSGIPGVPAGS